MLGKKKIIDGDYEVRDNNTQKLYEQLQRLKENLKNKKVQYKEAQLKAAQRAYEQIGKLVVNHYKIQTPQEIKAWFDAVKEKVPVGLKEIPTEENKTSDNELKEQAQDVDELAEFEEESTVDDNVSVSTTDETKVDDQGNKGKYNYHSDYSTY